MPLANHTVEFSLSTKNGSSRLGNMSDVSNINGKVSTVVFVGNIPMLVRVNVSVCVMNGD